MRTSSTRGSSIEARYSIADERTTARSAAAKRSSVADSSEPFGSTIRNTAGEATAAGLAVRGTITPVRHACAMETPPARESVVVVGFMDTGVAPLIRKWWLVLVLGIALVVIGVLLLVNTDAAAFTLALLVALGLFLAGIDSIVEAQRHRVRWPSYVMAALWIVVGAIALV